ncbi:MAG: hypothetical protein NTV06_02920 [candidate division Zixibacteria bacterium]|nr:hypothetical protein [candidate division Zixibacteria bacterium]
MAFTAAGLRLAAKAILVDGENGIGAATRFTDEETARVLYQAFLDNHSILTRHTAEEPFTCPCPPRERELLQFAKDYVTADQHPLYDEAIAIPDGLVITDPAGNYVTTIP